MQNETIIAGFGGQGVLFTGKVLAYAALEEGLEVTWFPSYGPEMRGGTANCTVVIADDEIGSPQVSQPRVAIVMNQPSLDKYEDMVKPGGYLAVNTSLTNRPVKRDDITIIEVPASEIAEELGNIRFANIVILGALASNADFIDLESIKKGLKKGLAGKKSKLLDANITALNKGAEYH